MITDFPSNPLSNMAGLQSFDFAPYQNVSSFPAVINDAMSSPVLFKAGLRFLKGFATVSTLNYTETCDNTEHGPVYTCEVTGFAPGRDPQLLRLLKEMTFSRHIVKAADFNKQFYLAGYQAPLNFAWTFASGMVIGEDKKGFAFRFYGQSTEPAPAYTV